MGLNGKLWYHDNDTAPFRYDTIHAANRDRTIVWCCAPGLFNGAWRSLDAMRDLTGMRLVPGKPDERVRLQIALTQDGQRMRPDPLPRDAEDTPALIGHEHVCTEVICVEDDQAVALGTLPGRG